jgi:hypothetical protein
MVSRHCNRAGLPRSRSVLKPILPSSPKFLIDALAALPTFGFPGPGSTIESDQEIGADIRVAMDPRIRSAGFESTGAS